MEGTHESLPGIPMPQYEGYGNLTEIFSDLSLPADTQEAEQQATFAEVSRVQLAAHVRALQESL